MLQLRHYPHFSGQWHHDAATTIDLRGGIAGTIGGDWVVKPGVPYDQIHKTAVRVLVEGLIDLGLLRGDAEEIANEKDEKQQKYRPYYMHRTGHWLGLEVHDAGIYYQDKDVATLLAPGQVFTIEPGLYIGPHTEPFAGQPAIPEEFRGIGVRIEDDILVTETGCEVLTAAVPK